VQHVARQGAGAEQHYVVGSRTATSRRGEEGDGGAMEQSRMAVMEESQKNGYRSGRHGGTVY
jgi:hypothetical protein